VNAANTIKAALTPNDPVQRAIKARPILFSTPMVQALLDGRKTQTRRVMKFSEFGISDTPGYDWHFRDKRALWQDQTHARMLSRCPYGQVGDQLWVRETFLADERDSTLAVMAVDGFCVGKPPTDKFKDVGTYADVGSLLQVGFWAKKPSIHMPRWASRITLEITGVRLERLQDISESDAMAEGIIKDADGGYASDKHSMHYSDHPIESYAALWESINGADSWELNPWVWVIEFRLNLKRQTTYPTQGTQYEIA
jgi:hypothetical protein